MTACVIMHNITVEDERDKASITRGGNFRMSWLPDILGRLYLRSSSICTKRFMITLFMFTAEEFNQTSIGIGRNDSKPKIVISSCFHIFSIKLCC
jgi:hypothetical protein